MNGKVYPFGGACNKYTAHKANAEIIDKNEFDCGCQRKTAI